MSARKVPRVPFTGATTAYITNRQVSCRGHNISTKGVLLVAPCPAAPGQYVRLMIQLEPETQWLDLDAILIHAEERGGKHYWGLSFQQVTPAQHERLRLFVAGCLTGSRTDCDSTSDRPSLRTRSYPRIQPKAGEGLRQKAPTAAARPIQPKGPSSPRPKPPTAAVATEPRRRARKTTAAGVGVESEGARPNKPRKPNKPKEPKKPKDDLSDLDRFIGGSVRELYRQALTDLDDTPKKRKR